ncbi:hypothetical protein LOD99_15198 [Oopsacas minuta]|uniref:RING-type domain-containing protein n=1 Tax=Oopsacas minuta TaxID=111878 RepID=A0AAV7KBF5_9METZ|nr:hypothetical protein LOD99_15198 [Oopsacas minuta]
MSKKTSTLYDKVVAKVIEILPFIASIIKTDFESSMYSSFAKGFPYARVSGCLFHYDRALYKTGILKKGLSNANISNLEFRQWVEQLMCLPLLPSDLIVPMFSCIKQEKPLLPQSENENVIKLLKYYERYWLGQVGPSRQSVFHTEKLTTNDLESFHANLKRKFKSHNPNYWDFIKNLNKVIQTTEKDIERIDNHVPIRRKKRPVTIQKEKYIDALQQQLINGDITPNNYLKTITHQYKTQFARFEGFIESVEDVDTENKEEDLIQDVSTEQNSNMCRICLVNVPDTLIMPCRHAQTCFSCTERIVNSDNNNCPICREPIKNFIKIFL